MKKPPQIKSIFSNWRKVSLLRIAKYVSVIIGSLVFISVLIFIFFHDPLINLFLKDKVIKAFNEANPSYTLMLGDINYSIWKNRLGCDSVTLKSNDSTFTIKVDSFSVSGIGWFKILLQREINTNNLTHSIFDAKKTIVNFHKSQNVFQFGKLQISTHDSILTADSIKYYSLIDDEEFFAKSQFRQTRFRLNVPYIKIIDLDFLSLLQGNSYKAGNITIRDVFVDILVNMDKPYDHNSSKPKMPNEVFSSIEEIVRIDSMKIFNGELLYSERTAVGAIPGVIIFSKMNVLISGITNDSTHLDSTIVNGEGHFMNSAKMKVLMKIPLTSPDFSLQYSGSLSAMDAAELNVFLKPAEHHLIKTGAIKSAIYNINVNSGIASGNVNVVYENFTIAILNEKTGREDGIVDRISTFIGKVFVIRRTNIPDKDGKMKIGEVKYTRDPEDYFFQFVWFALRSGLGDVIGF